MPKNENLGGKQLKKNCFVQDCKVLNRIVFLIKRMHESELPFLTGCMDGRRDESKRGGEEANRREGRSDGQHVSIHRNRSVSVRMRASLRR